MANEIVNLPNSFIRWCEDAADTCNDYSGVKLPIYNANDIKFMLEIDNTTEPYLESIAFMLIRGDYDVGDIVAVADIINGSLGFSWAEIETGNYAVFSVGENCEPTPLDGTYTYPAVEWECIHLVMATSSTRTVICKSLQQFYFTSDLCFTNLVRYKCTDNAFGFYYEEADLALAELNEVFYNQIRLPITLHSPKPLTEKTGFRDSSGRYMTLDAKKAKEWEVDADYFDDYLHQCLDAAIDHDKLFVFEDLISGCDYSDHEYYHDENDKYDIEWQEKPGQHLGVAKAKFKLKTNPYYSQNSNCG